LIKSDSEKKLWRPMSRVFVSIFDSFSTSSLIFFKRFSNGSSSNSVDCSSGVSVATWVVSSYSDSVIAAAVVVVMVVDTTSDSTILCDDEGDDFNDSKLTLGLASFEFDENPRKPNGSVLKFDNSGGSCVVVEVMVVGVLVDGRIGRLILLTPALMILEYYHNCNNSILFVRK
jgi:hypothetical protein